MKYKYILLIVCGLVFSLTSCFKPAKPKPIVGKWKEMKLRVYLLNHSGDISRDTTYLSYAFNNADYAQFDSNGGCVISSSRAFSPAGGPSEAASAYINKMALNYTPIASKYVLFYPNNSINPGGYTVADTAVMIGTDMVLIHSIFDNQIVSTVSDAYYTNYNKIY